MVKAARICTEPSVLFKSGLTLLVICGVWFFAWTQTADTATTPVSRTLTVFSVSPNLPFMIEASSPGGVSSSLTLICERQITMNFATKKSSLFISSWDVKQFRQILAEAKGDCLIFASATASGKVDSRPTLQLADNSSIIT